jgi:GNAT superfamily N-acetyltransferase
MIQYRNSLEGIRADQLEGFFVGWPNSPTPTMHLEMLKRSAHVALALEGSSVIGFVTAISDEILCAYIPLLEVLPTHQHQGIGSELMRRILETLREIYMIDLLCDPDLQAFYSRVGMEESTGMLVRNFDRQSGNHSAVR